jgi:hypothetical protein
MQGREMKSGTLIGLLGCTALALAAGASHAQEADFAVQATVEQAQDSDFSRFTPGSNPIAHRIDYSVLDDVLSYVVFRMGKSLRETPGRPDASLGSRRIYGHDSRYRLEGNRVLFSFFDADLKEVFSEYRRDLEATGATPNIAQLSRNEQLAYWINLHNVALVEQIAMNWPVRQPRQIMIDGVPLDEAKIVSVQGIEMSLKDIRTKIVYPNWKNPKVIYGFWHGDIGGPSIQGDAFNADNVGRLLERGATDFVNSLRGTQKLGNKLQVSRIYEEARPFYFQDWDRDLRNHISQYAEEDVRNILANTSETEAEISEYDIADMVGGVREPSYSNITVDGTSASFRIPQGMARLLSEQQRKFEKILREGRTGTVIFNDFRMPGEEEASNEVE